MSVLMSGAGRRTRWCTAMDTAAMWRCTKVGARPRTAPAGQSGAEGGGEAGAAASPAGSPGGRGSGGGEGGGFVFSPLFQITVLPPGRLRRGAARGERNRPSAAPRGWARGGGRTVRSSARYREPTAAAGRFLPRGSEGWWWGGDTPRPGGATGGEWGGRAPRRGGGLRPSAPAAPCPAVAHGPV